MFKTLRRIKWKNITGLVLFIIIIFVIITIVSFVSLMVHGDCVEKSKLKVCFGVDKGVIKQHEVTTIRTDVTNTGKVLGDAVISIRISPNLENRSAMAQNIKEMAPGDTVRKEFRIAAKEEIGRFKVEFDFNEDGLKDKEIFLTVEEP